jgi:acetate kinase
MPACSYLYAIPYEYYQNYGIRRYGFHGTSHKFVAQKACDILEMNYNTSKIITCHLGNGASITAINNGKSVDTSMGFTPVEGLMMGTRSGSVDPGVLMFLADKEHLDIQGVSDLVNKRSGVKGVAGLSSDMRDLEIAAQNGNERAQLAIDMYYYRVLKFVGAYAAILGGVDLIVFTGGVGENDAVLREFVGSHLAFMGVHFDADANRGVRGQDKVLTKENSRVKVMVCTTNEELVIATDTVNILNS